MKHPFKLGDLVRCKFPDEPCEPGDVVEVTDTDPQCFIYVDCSAFSSYDDESWPVDTVMDADNFDLFRRKP